jgi:hypothetical protein
MNKEQKAMAAMMVVALGVALAGAVVGWDAGSFLSMGLEAGALAGGLVIWGAG